MKQSVQDTPNFSSGGQAFDYKGWFVQKFHLGHSFIQQMAIS
jgi:hypothetical protein